MFNLDFMLIGEYVELYNFFKIIGFVDSGGIVKLIVVFGVVKVDGVVELCKICKICVGQVVLFGDMCIVVCEVQFLLCFFCL